MKALCTDDGGRAARKEKVMRDITERLRDFQPATQDMASTMLTAILDEAIEEIERLRAAAVGANVGAENQQHAVICADCGWTGARLLKGVNRPCRWCKGSGVVLRKSIAAGAAVKADEHSDEKSADTPVT